MFISSQISLWIIYFWFQKRCNSVSGTRVSVDATHYKYVIDIIIENVFQRAYDIITLIIRTFSADLNQAGKVKHIPLDRQKDSAPSFDFKKRF